jgi:hypothetical protein
MTVIVLTANNGALYWNGKCFSKFTEPDFEPTVQDYTNALAYVQTSGLEGTLTIETF